MIPALALGVLAAAAPLPGAAADEVVRLTPEQIAAIAAEAESKAAASARREAEPKRRIHGEIAASIGTGGTADIDAIADVRLGNDGEARISGAASRGLPQRPVRRNLDRR